MKTLVAAIFATFLVCSTASAQEGPSDRFPDSVTIVVEGERHQAFNLGNYVELLSIDKDLQDAIEEVALLESEVERFRLDSTSMREALRLSEENLRLVTEDRARLTELYRTTNLQLREVENKPNLLGIFGWSTTALAVGVITGLVVAMKVN